MRVPLFVLLAVLAWSGALADIIPEPLHDGQPGCHIRFEFQRLWRNNFVAGQYWECVNWGQPAQARNCPSGTLFQDAWQTCVHASQWEWTPYFDPPTRPCEPHDQCKELETDESTEIDECSTVTPTSPTPTTPTTTEETTPTEKDVFEESCPGATEEQHIPGTISCVAPECTMQQWLNGTLYPTKDPNFFYQCGPGTGNRFTMPCAPGTCFSFSQQVCVHARKWRNECV